MTLWLELARAAAAVNLGLLVALGWVWVPSYRRHGAQHTLGLLVFGGFLFVENALWVYFYLVHDDFIGWFVNSGSDVQMGVTALCGLELVALTFLVYVTWR